MFRRSVCRRPGITLLAIIELRVVHGLREWLARLGLDFLPVNFLFRSGGLFRRWW